MKQVIVVYNPASISSVITAAFLMHRCIQEDTMKLWFVKAYPAGNKIPREADKFIWVGVEPALNHLKQMTGEHHGYFINPKRSHSLSDLMTIHYPIPSVVNEQWEEALAMTMDSVFKSALCHHYQLVQDSETQQTNTKIPEWYIAKIAAEFESGQKLELEDQALVWINYQASLRYLMNLTYEYSFTGYPSGIDIHGKPNHQPIVIKAILVDIIDMYLEELKTLKQQITMMFETSMLNIGGEAKLVPLINVSQSQAPFILRLLSNTYDYAVTYVQRRGVNIYTAFSRIAGFDEVLLKAVNQGSQKSQAMMSYQL